MTELLVLMAHGSRDPRWRAPFEQLIADITHPAVVLCYMEMAEPTLPQAVAQWMTQHPQACSGLSRIRIWPLFWSAGSHVAQDIPRLVDDLRQQYPHLSVESFQPMGEHPDVQALIRQLITQQLNTPL
jgi:sirohydrochlorin cobaltochelatase